MLGVQISMQLFENYYKKELFLRTLLESKIKPLKDQMIIFSIKQLEKLENHVYPELSDILRNVDNNIINLNIDISHLYIYC